jgi:GTPase
VVGARGGYAHQAADAMDETRQLAASAGLEIVGELSARRERPDPAYFLGSGKVDELAAEIAAAGAGVAVFDVALTPAQQRNLERALDVMVLDRESLILDIFAQRAKSSEGKLQVEVAQLEHLATRLVRGWTHLERQRGGLGKTGGPGEKQIELDRRLIGVRVKRLRERLKALGRQRRTQRRARARRDIFSVSLVGYTNAGKSTLFNALTRAGSYAADQLFATLDTTSRRCFVADDLQVVVSDTVGFIRGLPHQLVDAFKSTLEESIEAELLLHVIDAASPAREAQMAEVDRVLGEIGAGDVPRLLVFNKIDRIDRAGAVERDPYGTIRAVFLSAASGDGIDLLREAIAEHVRAARSPEATTFEAAGAAMPGSMMRAPE